jgi:hypothetical protein
MVSNKTKANSKKSNRYKGTMLTQDINLGFEAIGSPFPNSSVTQNHSSCVTQPENNDAEDKDNNEDEQQNRDKLQKTNGHSTHVTTLQALKTTNNDHVIPSSYKTTTVKNMMKSDPIQMRQVVYLRLLKILTKQQTANAVYTTQNNLS